jgi:uncharacterized protein
VSERRGFVEAGGQEPPPSETLKHRLARELREAMKARETVRLGALRLLAAAVKNEEVRPEVLHDLSDEEFQHVVGREVKRRREAAEAFEAAGRPDRVEVELEEMRVLESYAPAALTEEEVDALIDDAVASTGAAGPADFGSVMRVVMAAVKGRADGKTVQEKVRARLSP